MQHGGYDADLLSLAREWALFHVDIFVSREEGSAYFANSDEVVLKSD